MATSRKRVTVALGDDEHACLVEAARAQGMTPAAYMRAMALFSAGWGKYTGPLFRPTERGDERDRSDAAVAHAGLRMLVELSRHVRQRFVYHEPPRDSTVRMMIAYCGLLTKFDDALQAMRRADDAVELAQRLLMNGTTIAEHHGLLGNAVIKAAEHILLVISPLQSDAAGGSNG
jgi:hypothetical protein